MLNRWNDDEATRFQALAGDDIADRDVALRVYTSHLIGADPDLVLHGGGNTSVKTRRRVDGEDVDVIHVKGSGWDLDTIEGPGLPGLKLRPLLEARSASRMSDDEMVAFLRANLLDQGSPNPSVETLMHAFLPAKFVDHSHASAVLALANQPDSAVIARRLYGERIAVVPYVMPGYDLSIEAAQVFDRHPGCEALWLDNHGIFTFGATARESYERMIEFVSIAERYLLDAGSEMPSSPPTREARGDLAEMLGRLEQVLRASGEPFVTTLALDYRADDNIDRYLAMDGLEDVSGRGTLTPDHVIRIKPFPLVAEVGDDTATLQRRIGAYAARYRDYFERNAARAADAKIMLDPLPRVVLVRSAGLVGLGRTTKEAAVAADLAVQTARLVPVAEKIGRFQPLAEAELFDMEYWSLEQAKLGRG